MIEAVSKQRQAASFRLGGLAKNNPSIAYRGDSHKSIALIKRVYYHMYLHNYVHMYIDEYQFARSKDGYDHEGQDKVGMLARTTTVE